MKNLFYTPFLIIALSVLCSLLPFKAMANNIQVSQVGLADLNIAQGQVLIQFDLSWDNSWRLNTAPANWDAAWVFVKFRKEGGVWQHAHLNYASGNAIADGHKAPLGSSMDVTLDSLGAFIYRSGIGTGDVNWERVGLRWNYGEDGVNPSNVIEFKVFAIEMVYVPEGNFRLGGGSGTEVGKFFQVSPTPIQVIPYLIDSEGPIVVNNAQGNLYYPSPAAHSTGDQLGPIPPNYPKGYAAFYCMKYEVSQAQWVDFFNTLTPLQKTNNDITDLDHRGPNPIDRNKLNWEGFGDATTELPFISMTFTEWSDAMAYMDWAGLRPMSEFEFVKACRGPQTPLTEEYAWGTDGFGSVNTNFHYRLINEEELNEEIINPFYEIGNANAQLSSYFSNDGPMRCGIFAASISTPGREESGATHYGIMEMSGNVSELAVNIGSPRGRAYSGIHGDGVLSIDGEADVNFWPTLDGKGGGLFGGSWFSDMEALWINDRRHATIGNIAYPNYVGFRCVRTAP